MLVHLPDNSGVGKLEAVDGVSCYVTIFRSIIRSEVIQLPVSTISRAYLSPQTRVYVRDDTRFRVGRVADFLIRENGLVDYEVRFPNGIREDFSELALHLRPWSAPEDPAEMLLNGGAETQFLHDRRQAAVLHLTKLRSAAQGMTALISAGIELASHQVAAVRRVLTDPVQRYLLADEVGLGKTIEAGLIVRQHLIDNPETSVLVAVPTHLCAQWQEELWTKLKLDQFNTVQVVPHAHLANVQVAPDILVLDEAHHLVGITSGPLAPAAAKLRTIACDAPVLLLLSATPALGDEARFLALLNLLDPATHPLDDVAGFRGKLERRREIGRLLLALDPDAPKLVLRQRCAAMEQMFPGDPVVMEVAPKLAAATRDAPEDVPGLCTALKNHIADSYRIHQRLIRSRRADAQGWEFSPRGPQAEGVPTFAHVRVEVAGTRWAESLLPVLEEWRFAAIDATSGDERSRDEAARRYAELLTAISYGSTALANWVADKSSRPAFAEETSILERLSALTDAIEPRPDYATACESTRRLVRSIRGEGRHAKIVAFSSTTANASAFHKAFSEGLDDCEVLQLGEEDTLRGKDTIATFTKHQGSAVLICDQSGEEGLNLAFADAIVHLDLPLVAGRLEQRIGRLDRFGRRHGVIRHRIMLPVDEDDSPWSGWSDFLCKGLGIFHRSISDVQFLLEDFERRAFRMLLERGPDGIRDLSAEVGEAIREERRSQDEQYALDRIALAEEPIETFIRNLEEAEEDEAALEDGVDRWLVNALLLKKQPLSWPQQDPFRLIATNETLIPKLPWLKAFALENKQPLTWRRRIAAAQPSCLLLRPGTPLVDVAERFTRWDDRGTAFITWRTVAEWSDEVWLGFRLCFLVEPDIAISDLFAPSRGELANVRRAQRYLPPQAICIHVDSNGDVVTDASLLSILMKPYLRAGARGEQGERGTDVNLSSRPQILSSVIDSLAFGDLCRSVRDRSRALLLAQQTLQDAITAGERHAKSEIERRRSRLRQKDAIGDAVALLELQAIESILPAISRPLIKLDSMGCFVISREPPVNPAYA
ncbi:protein DpdE [Aquabacterium lacunae]|nr:protein DpdE [Aquabacterium lacunae]